MNWCSAHIRNGQEGTVDTQVGHTQSELEIALMEERGMTLPADAGSASPVPDVFDPGGGANQVTRVRAYNERLVLSLVRQNPGCSKADIAA